MAITVTAGQILTADNINAFVPKYIEKSADESVTSSIAQQNDNDFAAISFGAGETWVCELYLTVTGDPAGDIATSWTSTGGVTQGRRFVVGMGLSGTDNNDSAFSNIASRASTGVANYGLTTSTTLRGGLRETFTVTTTTAGTITLTWAQRVSSVTASTILAGSFFIAHRVA